LRQRGVKLSAESVETERDSIVRWIRIVGNKGKLCLTSVVVEHMFDM
jgi:hypothetical protein